MIRRPPSSKTPVKIDPRTSVGNHGSVSVLGLVDGQWKQVKTIVVGLHPSGMVISKTGKFVYVANANSDTISVIDTATDKVIETINCRPENRMPFGSGCNALGARVSKAQHSVWSPMAATIASPSSTWRQRAAGNDPPAAHGIGGQQHRSPGLIPTGAGIPEAVQALSADGEKLFVANIKGHGLLA